MSLRFKVIVRSNTNKRFWPENDTFRGVITRSPKIGRDGRLKE